MRRVGILGGGQLGAMLAESIHGLGGEVHALDPDPDAPIARRIGRFTRADWADELALRRFAQECDVVTWETENVPLAAARAVALETELAPGVSLLEIAQDRAKEKHFLRGLGLPVVEHAVAERETELHAAALELGFPLIAKTALGGYDGVGQRRAGSIEELEAFVAELRADSGTFPRLVLERALVLRSELSCIVARGRDGTERVFPVFENVHRDHVLDVTLLPARVPATIARAATEISRRVARALDLHGLLTVELFLVDGPGAPAARDAGAGPRLVVNEIAPRAHNSGHVTRRACNLSQFDALARLLLGVALPAPRRIGSGAHAMGNLLGALWDERGAPPSLDACATDPDVLEIALYGKRRARPRRKMGHVIARGATVEAALENLLRARERLVPARPGERSCTRST